MPTCVSSRLADERVRFGRGWGGCDGDGGGDGSKYIEEKRKSH